MKINYKQFGKWIEALDSGRYGQAFGELQKDARYCCMGVACKVLVPKNKLLMDGNTILGVLPNAQRNAPGWLKDINSHFEAQTGKHLFELNDTMGFSFPEIATMLELVYIHKALEK